MNVYGARFRTHADQPTELLYITSHKLRSRKASYAEHVIPYTAAHTDMSVDTRYMLFRTLQPIWT